MKYGEPISMRERVHTTNKIKVNIFLITIKLKTLELKAALWTTKI